MSNRRDSRAMGFSRRRSRSGLGERIRLACAVVSLASWAFLSALYVLRPAGWDPITIWPFVLWAWAGVLLGLASLSRRAKRRSVLLVAAWLLALLTIPEEPRALLRSVAHGGEKAWRDARADGRALRLISLNCGGGLLDAAREALAHDPDIVLLQERPSGGAVQRVFREADGWHEAASLDMSVLVLGELEALPVADDWPELLCLARVRPSRLDPSIDLIVASVHLSRPAMRTRVWLRSTWRAAERARQQRLAEMQRVAAYAAQRAHAEPTIFGGDYNTPGGDGLFRALRPYLRDAFYEAGVGWPNTISNDSPVSRIDQVWISSHLQAATLRVVRTQNSDHRMVVCDLVLGS